MAKQHTPIVRMWGCEYRTRPPYSKELRELYPQMHWVIGFNPNGYFTTHGAYTLVDLEPPSTIHAKAYIGGEDAATPRMVKELMTVREIQFLAGMLT